MQYSLTIIDAKGNWTYRKITASNPDGACHAATEELDEYIPFEEETTTGEIVRSWRIYKCVAEKKPGEQIAT